MFSCLCLQRLSVRVQELYDEFLESNSSAGVESLSDLPQEMYADSDIPERFPPQRKFNPYVNIFMSLIKRCSYQTL